MLELEVPVEEAEAGTGDEELGLGVFEHEDETVVAGDELDNGVVDVELEIV